MLTLTKNNSRTSKESNSGKKEKIFSFSLDENTSKHFFGKSKMFKKKTICKNLEHNIPGCLHYERTNDYTKVVAKPSLYPIIPGIFEINESKKDVSDTSDSFLLNFVPSNSFNTNKNERFFQIGVNNKKIKKNKEMKKNEKKEKSKKEISTVEKKENKKIRRQEQKEIQELNQRSLHEYDRSINTEFESTINQVDIYQVSGKNCLIFHMCHPSKFSFNGEFKITIIAGEVEVLGYTLSSLSSRDCIDVYSPNFCTPLVVETKLVKQGKSIEETLIKLKNSMTENDYNKCYKNLKPEDSVLLIEQIKSNFGIVINKYFDLPVFPKDLEDVFLMTETLKNLQSVFTFKFSKSKKHFRKNPQWDKIPLGQCTVLCGGKGVGKSTLLKYYINKFIALGEKVLCLDFDPGQPEFNFPGCVSAVIIDQPLLGPNFTHVMDPVLMLNYGNVDVSPDPTKYLECVKFIIEYCKKNESLLKMKWFVNTMGFCKGLGVSLLITTLKLLEPNTVIQIRSSDYKNNYPFYLTPVTLNSQNGFRSIPMNEVILSYDLRVIYSCAEHNKKQLQGGLKQRQLRDIMAISYFSQAVSAPFYNFNAVQPYLISFSELYLGINFFINPNEVLKAFNGSIVALSHFEPDTEEIFSVESEMNVYFKVVIKPALSPCLGIGFVRGIDCQEKKFYITTHLPIETLNKINCLTLGKVSAPHSMFLKQETVEGQTVYTTSGSVDIIHRVRRTFRVPGTPQLRKN